MTGRYVRLTKGQLVCSRHDLQGVVAHLHDLARHLEALIPDDDAWERLTKSRDFAGGFDQRAEYEKALDEAVLEVLATRRDRHPYEPVQIEGYSIEHVESAVLRLWKAGLVDAHSLTPKQVTPSTLTTKGFRALNKLGKELATKGKD
jgi:hypothetical protein